MTERAVYRAHRPADQIESWTSGAGSPAGARTRVAIVSESPLTAVNGVNHCVFRTVQHLIAAGHDVLVVAPGPAPAHMGRIWGARCHPVRSAPLPWYPSFRVGLATARQLGSVLSTYRPDLVHLASPILLGDVAVRVATRLAVPTVAVFQTDLAAFARRNGLGVLAPLVWRRFRRLHRSADLTLAPSTATMRQLHHHGIERVALWRRGVDTDLFEPAHRSEQVRRMLAPAGETIIGYVGRLAADKRVRLLRHVSDLPGTRLVVVGDGPSARMLHRSLPRATFTGLTIGTVFLAGGSGATWREVSAPVRGIDTSL